MKSLCRLIIPPVALYILSTLPAYAANCYAPSPTVQADRDLFEFQSPEALSRSEQKSARTLFSRLEGQWEGRSTRIECLGSEVNVREKQSHAEIILTVDERSQQSLFFNADIYIPHKKSTYREKFSLYQAEGYLRVDSRGADGDVETLHLKRNELQTLQRYFVRHQKPLKEPDSTRPDFKRPDVRIQPVPDVSIQPVDDVRIQPVQTQPVGDVQIQPVFTPPEKETSWFDILLPAPPETTSEMYYSDGGAINELVRTITVNGRKATIETTLYTNGFLSSKEYWSLKKKS